MIVTGPEGFPVVDSDKELPLEKYGALGVLTVGVTGPPIDMDSKVVVGTELRERCNSSCRGLSVGGRGAGPGFMNCPEV